MLTVGVGGHTVSVVWAVLAALFVSCGVGLLNGLLVSRIGVAPFIATLGTRYIARGAALPISNGKTFPNLGGTAAGGSTGFSAIGQSFVLGVPLPVWLMILIAAVASAVALRTPFGRHVYAVGGNERAARLAGIRVGRVKLLTSCFSGLCAGLVGLIIASQLESAHPATGESFELNAIAAAMKESLLAAVDQIVSERIEGRPNSRVAMAQFRIFQNIEDVISGNLARPIYSA